jgi:hypothetical protein
MLKPFSDDEIKKAYDAAPTLIKEAVDSDLVIDFGVSLPTKYGLHLDVTQTIVTLIRNLLIGLLNPKEFYDEIQALRIDQGTAQRLVTDLNEQVFLPIREKMQEVSEEEASEAREPQGVVPAPAPVSVPATAPTAPISKNLIHPDAPVSVPATAPAVVTPTVAAPLPTPPTAPYYIAPAPVQPVAEAVHLELPPTAVPAIVAPTPTPVVPPTLSAPRPLPPQPSASASASASGNKDALHDVLKKYGIDPYREPAQ